MSSCLVSSCDEKFIVTGDNCGVDSGQVDFRSLIEDLLSPFFCEDAGSEGQKYLDRTSITLLILHVQAGKRRKTRFSPSATRTRTTTVIIKTKKKRGIVSKAW